MADTKVSDLSALTTLADDDEFVVVDKSDTTMAASGTTKKITRANVGSAHTIEEEGSALAQRASLNFTGAGVSAADSGGKTVVTIPGAAGGGGTAMTLANSIAKGDTTCVLSAAAPSEVQVGQFVMIDPWTDEAELRRVTAISGDRLTLTFPTQEQVVSTGVWFDAATKRIRVDRVISSISKSGTTVTVVTSQPHQLANGNSVFIYGTTNFNWRDPSSPSITVTNSTTFTYTDTDGTAKATETTGTTVKSDLRNKLGPLFAGETINITGSASNNGLKTVVSADWPENNGITISETVVDENSNASNTFAIKLNFAHSAGDRVLHIPTDRIDLGLYGVKADGNTASATQNRRGLQRAINDCYHGNTQHLWLTYPLGGASGSGTLVYVDGPIYWEREVHYDGLDAAMRMIAATGSAGSWGWPNNEIAIFVGRHDGDYSHYQNAGDGSRHYFVNTKVDGLDITGSNGVLMSSQQPVAWDTFRTDNCAGYGTCVVDAQQHIIRNFEAIGNGVGYVMRQVEFAYHYDFNVEQSTVAHVRSQDKDLTVGSGGAGFKNRAIHFIGVHLENWLIGPPIGFDVQSVGQMWMIENFIQGNESATQASFKFSGASAAIQENALVYTIRAAFNTASTSGLFLEDTARGLSLLWSYFGNSGGMCQEFHGAPANYSTSYSPTGEASYHARGMAGAWARLGAPMASGSYDTACFGGYRPNTGATDWIHAVYNDSNVVLAGLRASGDVYSAGKLQHAGSQAGFFGTTPIGKPDVSGSRGGNAALADLLTELANLGLITNSSTA